MLDELDFQLINALEIAPRTAWSTLAPALRTDASTLSRRWSRLTDAGLAWTTCYVLPERMQANAASGAPLRSSFAVIELLAARRDDGRRHRGDRTQVRGDQHRMHFRGHAICS